MYKTIQHFCCLFYQITLIWIFLKLIICVTKWPFNLDLILLNTWSTVSDHDIKFFVLNNNLNLDSQNWLYRDNKHWWLSATTCCKCEELALYISSVNKSEGRSELDTAFFFFLFFFISWAEIFSFLQPQTDFSSEISLFSCSGLWSADSHVQWAQEVIQNKDG